MIDLQLDEHGAALHARAAGSILTGLEAALSEYQRDRAGVRLHDNPQLAALLDPAKPVGRIAADQLGALARPVRAVLFDKTPGTNWSLSWHQDRTIAVQARHELSGWGPWSVKAGVQHVEPPFQYIEAMLTLRVHLDDVPADNAPLLVAPGSHRLGRIPTAEIGRAVENCGTMICLADRGDIWAYATPIVHASAASSGHSHRRVPQVDYAACALPAPMDWLGI